MRRAFVFVLALAGTAACSYIFELPSTAVLPTDPDAANDDGAVDATLDLGPIPEAAPPPPPFCPTQTAPFLYCADFDGEPAPDLASIGPLQVAGGELVLASAVSRSGPRSLLATLRGPNAAGAVTHALGTDPDGLTFSFEQLVSIWQTTDAQLAAVVLESGTRRCTVQLGGGPSTWTLTQECSDNGAPPSGVTADTTSPIVRGRWQTFRIQIAFAPTVNVAVDIDGVRTNVAGIAELQRAPASVLLGAPSVPDGNVTVFQDNVLVTTP